MVADIDALPGIRWNPKAALHDALNRCPDDGHVVILWTNKELTSFQYSVHSTNAITAWLLHYALKKLLDWKAEE